MTPGNQNNARSANTLLKLLKLLILISKNITIAIILYTIFDALPHSQPHAIHCLIIVFLFRALHFLITQLDNVTEAARLRKKIAKGRSLVSTRDERNETLGVLYHVGRHFAKTATRCEVLEEWIGELEMRQENLVEECGRLFGVRSEGEDIEREVGRVGDGRMGGVKKERSAERVFMFRFLRRR